MKFPFFPLNIVTSLNTIFPPNSKERADIIWILQCMGKSEKIEIQTDLIEVIPNQEDPAWGNQQNTSSSEE